MNDVTLNKVAVIERCLGRIAEEYDGNSDHLRHDITRQDSIVLNLLRAIEAAIDLAMHRVRERKLGVPQSSRDAFEKLAGAGELDPALAVSLQRMVGFRNIAVHDYQTLSLDIVEKIVQSHLRELSAFAHDMLQREARES